MTEENNTNTESVVEIKPEAVEKAQEIASEATPTDRVAHKPSNMRSRWKRNSAGTATIKEDDSKLPKEIKAVKLATAERINKESGKKRNPNYEKTEKCNMQCDVQKKCCCCSFLCKMKRFVLSLFGIKSKKAEKKYNKNSRGHRYSNQRRRGNYRGNSRKQTR
ncbi:MAG: hypothetical protein ACSW8C_02630 [bacterium]